MPIGELELHPYLHTQIPVGNLVISERFKFLVVGTFPIYPLTISQPIEMNGHLMRANWHEHAAFQFFYGSMKNHFWNLFAAAFNQPVPLTATDAINLLNLTGFIITDVVYSTERLRHLTSDSAIAAHRTLNTDQLNYFVNNIVNLRAIFFTSFIAKKWFCEAMGLHYTHVSIDQFNYNGAQIHLFVYVTSRLWTIYKYLYS